MLSDRCLSVCLSLSPVGDVGVLWPNGWMDQDETWHAGRPRPLPHCVRSGPSSPSPKMEAEPPNFWPISVAAKWLQGSRCHLVWTMEVGLGPGDFMSDGDPAPSSPKGAEPPIFRPMFIVAKLLDGSRSLLAWR